MAYLHKIIKIKTKNIGPLRWTVYLEGLENPYNRVDYMIFIFDPSSNSVVSFALDPLPLLKYSKKTVCKLGVNEVPMVFFCLCFSSFAFLLGITGIQY